MTADEIEKAWHMVNRYGPSNGWTGTTGPLAAALGRALKEIDRLQKENDRLQEVSVLPQSDIGIH